ncbi:MAG TPA: MFS transporter [Longimicrobiales bacterium]|nr:MFS transporter [Longimicrobiales bacterium]
MPHPLAVSAAVAVAHGLNDLYAAFLHPLLPRIMEKLGLNIALAATLAMTLSLAASVVQPIMGHLADRFGRRAFVVLGPLFSGVFMSLIGVAPTFGALIFCLALGGLGSAAFHPPGASMATSGGGGKSSGARLSVFSFGGSFGYALGPLVAVTLAARLGLERLWYGMVPLLLLLPVLYFLLPSGHSDRLQRARSPIAHAPLGPLLRGPLGLVFGVSAVGAFVQRVFLTMEPIMISRAGGSETAGAAMLSVYLGAQALGSIGGGFLADRADRRSLLLWLTLLSFPAHTLAMWLPAGAPITFAVAAIAGFLNMALLPPIVLMAQELMPAGAALGSGIVMGLAWATGSIAMLGIGVLADAIGAQPAALVAMPAMLIGAVFAAALPRQPTR